MRGRAGAKLAEFRPIKKEKILVGENHVPKLFEGDLGAHNELVNQPPIVNRPPRWYVKASKNLRQTPKHPKLAKIQNDISFSVILVVLGALSGFIRTNDDV